MGKAKRFNSYDSIIDESRKITQAYGQARQDLSIKSFRSMPQQPPTFNPSIFQRFRHNGEYISASLSTGQTTNLAANDHVEFDQIDEDGGIELQTGSGQANGIFELLSGGKYLLSAQVGPQFSGATGQLVIHWFDRTNSTQLGRRAFYEPHTNTSHFANQPVASVIVTPTTNIDVEVRIVGVTALTALIFNYTIVNIFEISSGGGSGAGGGGGNGVTFPLTPDVNVMGNITGTVDIDLSQTDAHYHTGTLTGNVTFTFSNPPTIDKEMSFTIDITQDATGGRTVDWPGSVRVEPTVGSGANDRTVIFVWTVDNGTFYDAEIVTGGTVNAANKQLSNLGTTSINADLLFANANLDIASTGTPLDGLFVKRVVLEPGTINAGETMITEEATNKLVLNVATGGKIDFRVNNSLIFDIDSGNLSGNNIILSNVLTMNDNTSDPSSNGAIARNGDDLRVFTGGLVKDLSNLATTMKSAVRVATTANITLSAEQTIDGVLTSTDRILVKDQTTGEENGIYVTAAGAWTRATDYDDDDKATSGSLIVVQEGTASADTVWTLTTNEPITLGTTSLTYSEFVGGGANRQLSNLSGTVAVNLNLVPNQGTGGSLGSGVSTEEWFNLYVQKVRFPVKSTLAVGSNIIQTVNNSGNDDMVFNVISSTADRFLWTMNGVNQLVLTSTELVCSGVNVDMENNNITDVNQLQITGASGDTVFGSITGQTNVLDISNPETSGTIRLFCDNSSDTQIEMINITADSPTVTFGKDGATATVLDDVGTVQFAVSSGAKPSILAVANALRLHVGTGESFGFEINATDEMTLNATQLDVIGKNIVGVDKIEIEDTLGNAVGDIRGVNATPDILEIRLGATTDFLITDNGTTRFSLTNTTSKMRFVGTSGVEFDTDFIALNDVTTNPSTPATGFTNIFVFDDGAGNQTLRVKFDNGTVKDIATDV